MFPVLYTIKQVRLYFIALMYLNVFNQSLTNTLT